MGGILRQLQTSIVTDEIKRDVGCNNLYNQNSMKKIHIGIMAGSLLVSAGALSVFAENVTETRGPWHAPGTQNASSSRGNRMGMVGEGKMGMMGSSTMGMMRENSDKQIMGKVTAITGNSLTLVSPSRTDRTVTSSYAVDFSSAKIEKNGAQISVSGLAVGDYVHITLVGKITETPLVASNVFVMNMPTRMMGNGSTTPQMMGENGNERGAMHVSNNTVAQPQIYGDTQTVKQGFFKRIGGFFSSFFH